MANVKTTTTTATRKSATRKPGKPVASPIDAIVKLAGTVNPANVLDMIRKTTGTFTTPTRNVGRYTGQRIVAFQNWTLEQNATWQLDDCQLAFVWSVEFPFGVGRVFAMNPLPGVRPVPSASAIRDAITIVRGVRSDYNRGTHAQPAGKPKTESMSYGSRRFDIHEPETAKPSNVADAKLARRAS